MDEYCDDNVKLRTYVVRRLLAKVLSLKHLFAPCGDRGTSRLFGPGGAGGAAATVSRPQLLTVPCAFVCPLTGQVSGRFKSSLQTYGILTVFWMTS